MQNYPNPFNPHTTIAFTLAKDTMVSLNVYNTKGQKVRSLHSGNLTSGKHALSWNGKDDRGATCASGLYFYRLEGSEFSETRKMLLMK